VTKVMQCNRKRDGSAGSTLVVRRAVSEISRQELRTECNRLPRCQACPTAAEGHLQRVL